MDYFIFAVIILVITFIPDDTKAYRVVTGIAFSTFMVMGTITVLGLA